MNRSLGKDYRVVSRRSGFDGEFERRDGDGELVELAMLVVDVDWNSSSPGRGIVKVERGREMSFAEKKSQWLVEEREVVWNSGDRSRDK